LDDGVDRYLGINRRDERFLARKICRYVRHAGVIFGEPIPTSNCALAWSGASSCYGVLPRKDRHGELAQPRRQCGARIDLDGSPFAAWEHRNFARSATTVATASLIENWIDG
jgi:hypothetical protein